MKTDHPAAETDSRLRTRAHDRSGSRLTPRDRAVVIGSAAALGVVATLAHTVSHSAEQQERATNMETITSQQPGTFTLLAGAHGHKTPYVYDGDGAPTPSNITFTVPKDNNLVIKNPYELQNGTDTWLVVPRPGTQTTSSPNLNPHDATYFDLTQLGQQNLAYDEGSDVDALPLKTVSVTADGVVTDLDGSQPLPVSAVLTPAS